MDTGSMMESSGNASLPSLSNYFSDQFRNLTVMNVVIALAFALVVGVVIAFVYKRCYRGVLYSPNFSLTLIMMTVITTPVVMCIKSDIAQGVSMQGFTALPATLQVQSSSPAGSTALVTVQEGQFHQIKRMFHCVRCTVCTLQRIRFGSLPLPGDMEAGAWRELTRAEVRLLYADAAMPCPLDQG